MTVFPPPEAPPDVPFRVPSGRGVHHLLLSLILVSLTALTVLRGAEQWNAPRGWASVARAAPVLAAVGVQGVVAVALALLIHHWLGARRMWIAIGLLLAIATALLTADRSGVRLQPVARPWVWGPFLLLLMLGSIHGIPRELEEAAAVDRAGPGLRLRAITLPLIAPALLLGLIFCAADSLCAPHRRVRIDASYLLLIVAIIAAALLSPRRAPARGMP